MAKIPIRFPDNANDYRPGCLFYDTEQKKIIIYTDNHFNTITEKMPEGWVNVKDFGAKGDGVTDDTQAFVDAINFANNVFIPSGEYIINTIEITKEAFLLGSGKSSRISIQGNGFILHDSVKIENLTINGNGHSVFTIYGSRNIIRNVDILQPKPAIKIITLSDSTQYSEMNFFENMIIDGVSTETQSEGIILDSLSSNYKPRRNRFSNIMLRYLSVSLIINKGIFNAFDNLFVLDWTYTYTNDYTIRIHDDQNTFLNLIMSGIAESIYGVKVNGNANVFIGGKVLIGTMKLNDTGKGNIYIGVDGLTNTPVYLQSIQFKVTDSFVPPPVAEGTIRFADGTKWDPGSGKGLYIYYSGSWHKIG